MSRCIDTVIHMRREVVVRVIYRRRVGGFSLVELLVVLAIVVLLSAIVVPVVGHVRSAGRRTVCASNLSQVGKSFYAYANDNRGEIPAVYDGEKPGRPADCLDAGGGRRNRRGLWGNSPAGCVPDGHCASGLPSGCTNSGLSGAEGRVSGSSGEVGRLPACAA